MSDLLSGWINICCHESGGVLAETGGLAVPHPRPQPTPSLFNSKKTIIYFKFMQRFYAYWFSVTINKG